MIFKLALIRNRIEKQGSLIAALRGQGKIYHEALDVHQKMNFFSAGDRSSTALKVMPLRVMNTIRKIRI